MGFIYGIVDFDKEAVLQSDVNSLGDAFEFNSENAELQVFGRYALGYNYHTRAERKPTIFRLNRWLILADVKIFNHNYLSEFFSYQCDAEALL